MDKKAKQDRDNARKKRDYKTYCISLHNRDDRERIRYIMERTRATGESRASVVKEAIAIGLEELERGN